MPNKSSRTETSFRNEICLDLHNGSEERKNKVDKFFSFPY